MTGADDAKAAHWRNIPTAWTAVLVTISATGCDGVADRSSSPSSDTPVYLIAATLERSKLQRMSYPQTPPSPQEDQHARAIKAPVLSLSLRQPTSASPTGDLEKETASLKYQGSTTKPGRLAINPPLPTIQAPPAPTAEAKLPKLQLELGTELAIAELGGAPQSADMVAESAANSPAYVSQISDSVRIAYIAQVDLQAAEQRLTLRSGGEALGKVEFQVAGSTMSVHIGQVLELFKGKMDAAHFTRLRTSPAASEFVSLDRLKSAGISIEYNPAYDEIVLSPEGAVAAT